MLYHFQRTVAAAEDFFCIKRVDGYDSICQYSKTICTTLLNVKHEYSFNLALFQVLTVKLLARCVEGKGKRKSEFQVVHSMHIFLLLLLWTSVSKRQRQKYAENAYMEWMRPEVVVLRALSCNRRRWAPQDSRSVWFLHVLDQYSGATG